MNAETPTTVVETKTPIGKIRTLDYIGDIDIQRVLASGHYSSVLDAQKRFDVHLGRRILDASSSYRSRMFSQGQYLGHHVGVPGDAVVGHNTLHVRLQTDDRAEYRRVFWTYVLKVVLTLRAIELGVLHLKAVTIANGKSKGILLVGRGGSGKSSLAKQLNNSGLYMLGNTHAIVSTATVWAVPTWVRERDDMSDNYLPIPPSPIPHDCALHALVIVDHNARKKFSAFRCTPSDVSGFLRQYACAIGAYDLKEDVFDAVGGFNAASLAFASANTLLDSILVTQPIFYLSADIFDADSRQQASSFLLRLLA